MIENLASYFLGHLARARVEHDPPLKGDIYDDQYLAGKLQQFVKEDPDRLLRALAMHGLLEES